MTELKLEMLESPLYRYGNGGSQSLSGRPRSQNWTLNKPRNSPRHTLGSTTHGPPTALINTEERAPWSPQLRFCACLAPSIPRLPSSHLHSDNVVTGAGDMLLSFFHG